MPKVQIREMWQYDIGRDAYILRHDVLGVDEYGDVEQHHVIETIPVKEWRSGVLHSHRDKAVAELLSVLRENEQTPTTGLAMPESAVANGNMIEVDG